MVWWELLLLAIGFMSGALSIIRETFTLVFPDQSETHARKRFLACMRLAFILAAATLWYDEHKKVINLSADVPHLSARVEELTWGSNSVKPEIVPGLFVISVSNSGSASIVNRYSVGLLLPNNKVANGTLVTIPNSFAIHGEDGKILYTLDSASALYEKTMVTPLPKGDVRTGVLMVNFNRQEFDSARRFGPPTIVIEFQDYLQTPYSLRVKTGTAGPGFRYFPGLGGKLPNEPQK